ncbi:TPA: cysteine peptidase family C39 domain-containing protein, partial [Escherichia coli]
MDSCHKIDYGLYALEILAQYHNVSVNPEEIKHRFDTDGTGLGLTSWLLAAKSLELKVKQVKKTIDRLNFIPLPALVWREDGRHFILTKVSKEANRYLIFDLEQRNPRVLEQSEFEAL